MSHFLQHWLEQYNLQDSPLLQILFFLALYFTLLIIWLSNKWTEAREQYHVRAREMQRQASLKIVRDHLDSRLDQIMERLQEVQKDVSRARWRGRRIGDGSV